MVANAIPEWIIELDRRKPYIEVLDDRKLPAVSPQWVHGAVAGALYSALREWGRGRGIAAVEVRFYFARADGTWSSFLPDTCFMSYERFPEIEASDESYRPLIAPDIAVDVLSPDDRPARMNRKVQSYLEFGSFVVLVVDPKKRRVALHRPAGTEEREARGAWVLEPFENLVLDWERIFEGVKRR
jgi:Uma2 family endonuclease